ncbi:MAG: hypothetical protein ACR2GY_05755 [Phycisphaerales bacterium]
MMTVDEQPPFPPLPLWLSIAWAISPAVIMLTCVLLFTRQWPYLGWVGFLAGVLNLFAWSAMHLCQRQVEHWEVKAVPLTFIMLLGNMALIVAGSLAIP